MPVVTIPKKLARSGDLVVVPRVEYDALLRVAAKHVSQQRSPVKRTDTSLDRDLDQALLEYRTGQYHGPFDSADDADAFIAKQMRQ